MEGWFSRVLHVAAGLLLIPLVSGSDIVSSKSICAADGSDGKFYSFYIVPQRSLQATYGAWAPFLQKVEEKTDLCIEPVIPVSIPDFERDLIAGKADLAYANPYHLIMGRESHDYRPLLRDGSQQLTGLIVSHVNSDVNTIDDLEGRTIALPAPNAFGASILTQLAFSERQINVNTVYAGSHTNTYRSVVVGRVAAGGGVNNTLKRESESVRSQLRVIFETKGHPSHPVIARSTISDEKALMIIAAIQDLAKNPNHAKLLEAVQLPDPVPATLDDYLYLANLPWNP